MKTRPKQIVIDKDAFIAFSGRRFEELCSLAQEHVLLLSDALLYECATATKQRPGTLLVKCTRLIQRGGYVCPGNHAHFVEWEIEHSSPYPRSLMDIRATKAVRDGQVRPEEMANSRVAQEVSESRKALAAHMLADQSAQTKEALAIEHPEVGNAIRSSQKSRSGRFREIVDTVDRSDISGTAMCRFGDRVSDANQFCTSSDWIAWHFIRLVDALTLEHYFLRETGVPGNRQVEHDLLDMEYVLLLSRADGIITRDKKLVEPLARAAFPEKDVFSSLEEVPESYRCDWAEG